MNLTPERLGYGIGAGLIVSGGLVAAVTGPLLWARGSWLAAYLVLICGVAQCIIVRQRSYLEMSAPSRSSTIAFVLVWNIGNGLVIRGTIATFPLIADLGGILLVAGLVFALVHTRGSSHPGRATALRLLYLIIAVSVPIGLVLTHLRAESAWLAAAATSARAHLSAV